MMSEQNLMLHFQITSLPFIPKLFLLTPVWIGFKTFWEIEHLFMMSKINAPLSTMFHVFFLAKGDRFK
jgi:hypothetical protein